MSSSLPSNRIEINERCVIGIGIFGVIAIAPFLVSSGVGIAFVANEQYDGAKDIFVVEHILSWLALVMVLFVGCIYNIRVKIDFQRVARTKKSELYFEPSETVEEAMVATKTQSSKAEQLIGPLK